MWGDLFEQLDFFSETGYNSILFGDKPSQIDFLAVVCNVGDPFATLLVKENSSHTGGVRGIQTTISVILRTVATPQILLAVKVR